MRAVTLKDEPSYETISYAWGNLENSKTILINGCEISIRANLESALRHLRQVNEPLSLWADALCIDQENVLEKTHQVSMMGRIYSACRRVYIWFGDPGSAPAENVTTMPIKQVNDTLAWNNPFALVEHFAADKHYHELPGYKPLNTAGILYEFDAERLDPIWKGLVSAFSSEWWTRLWCVQEALLPPKAIVVFGHWRIDWRTFITAVNNNGRHSLSCCASAAKLMGSRFVFRVDDLVLEPAILNTSHYAITTSGNSNMDAMLRRYRYKKCQDPRDKVYGLLGVIEKGQIRTFTPDYSLTLRDVFINATSTIIDQSYGDLCFLTGSGFNSRLQGLPSWVRDLSAELDEHLIYPESQRLKTYDLYNACNGTTSGVRQEDRKRLNLRGIHIGKIKSIGQAARTRDISHLNDVLRSWHGLAGLDHSASISYPSNQKHDSFWRTVSADVVMDSNNIWSRLSSAQLYTHEAWSSLFPFTANSTTQSSLGRTFLLTLRAAVCGRAMFITERGYMGLCPPESRVGDQIWVLYGGKVPFVLRPTTPDGLHHVYTFAFIGDCFLDGFMDGEAFRVDNNEQREVSLV